MANLVDLGMNASMVLLFYGGQTVSAAQGTWLNSLSGGMWVCLLIAANERS